MNREDIAKKLLKIVPSNPDMEIIRHILKFPSPTRLSYLEKICERYKDALSEQNIKLSESLKNTLIFKVRNNVISVTFSKIERSLFYLIIDELKSLGFMFDNKPNPPEWWIISRELSTTILKIKQSRIFNKCVIQIEYDEEQTVESLISKLPKDDLKTVELSRALNSQLKVTGLNHELYSFQNIPVEYMSDHKGILIADMLGVGKSIEAIGILHHHNLFPAVIVCPAILKQNWEREIKKWMNKSYQIFYTGKDKVEEKDIYILNYDLLGKICPNLPLKKLKCSILDESHNCKNPKTKRYQAVKKYLNKIPYRIAMSGTPIVNKPSELVSQLEYLGVLDKFGGKWKFIRDYANPEWNGFGYDYSSSHEHELQIMLRKTCMVRRKKEDVLELPPKTKQEIYLRLPSYTKYNEIERDLINWYKTKLSKKGVKGKKANILIKEKQDKLRFNEALVKIEYLKQAVADFKFKQSIEFIDNLLEQTNKIVCYGHHIELLDRFHSHYKNISVCLKGGMQKHADRLVQQFQNDTETRIFFGSLDATSEGITLTSSPIVVFLQLPWTPAKLEQTEDRVHRIGQVQNVNIYYLITEDTIEEYIYELIRRKEKITDKATNVNSIFSRILEKHH